MRTLLRGSRKVPHLALVSSAEATIPTQDGPQAEARAVDSSPPARIPRARTPASLLHDGVRGDDGTTEQIPTARSCPSLCDVCELPVPDYGCPACSDDDPIAA